MTNTFDVACRCRHCGHVFNVGDECPDDCPNCGIGGDDFAPQRIGPVTFGKAITELGFNEAAKRLK